MIDEWQAEVRRKKIWEEAYYMELEEFWMQKCNK